MDSERNQGLGIGDQGTTTDRALAPTPESLVPDPQSLDQILLTAKDVARLLGISVRSVWALASSGEIPRPVKLRHARITRWRRADLEEWAKGLK